MFIGLVSACALGTKLLRLQLPITARLATLGDRGIVKHCQIIVYIRQQPVSSPKHYFLHFSNNISHVNDLFAVHEIAVHINDVRSIVNLATKMDRSRSYLDEPDRSLIAANLVDHLNVPSGNVILLIGSITTFSNHQSSN